MLEKEFLVRSVPMIAIDGSPNVPAVLYFGDGGVEIGQSALRKVREQGGILNQDFKVDLGNIDPQSPKRADEVQDFQWSKQVCIRTDGRISARIVSAPRTLHDGLS